MQPLGRTLSFPIVLYKYCLFLSGNFACWRGSREPLHITRNQCVNNDRRGLTLSSLLTLHHDSLNKIYLLIVSMQILKYCVLWPQGTMVAYGLFQGKFRITNWEDLAGHRALVVVASVFVVV